MQCSALPRASMGRGTNGAQSNQLQSVVFVRFRFSVPVQRDHVNFRVERAVVLPRRLSRTKKRRLAKVEPHCSDTIVTPDSEARKQGRGPRPILCRFNGRYTSKYAHSCSNRSRRTGPRHNVTHFFFAPTGSKMAKPDGADNLKGSYETGSI